MKKNSSESRFKNITLGYIGIKHTQSTLNSMFYAELLAEKPDLNKHIILPQRVPKNEFFEETMLLEEENIAQLLKDHQTTLIKMMNHELNAIENGETRQRSFLNHLNLLLRYGLASDICNIDISRLQSNMDINDLTEFELIQEIAFFRTAPLEANTALCERLNNFTNKVFSDPKLCDRVKMLSLSYVIVAVYRFHINLPYENISKRAYEELLMLLENEKQEDFGIIMRKSIAYRGIAMVGEIDSSLQIEYLKKAESLARNIKPSTVLEEITAKENLYTCLQSLAKWNQKISDFEAAQSNLLEMITLDPQDSTGYAELGFLLLEQNHVKEAAINFSRAADLGPPAVGMHTYYYAKSLQLLGDKKEAIMQLHKVTEIDKEAVSPWLDLIELYSENQQQEEVKKIITLILNNPIYTNQLEADEISQLENNLKS